MNFMRVVDLNKNIRLNGFEADSRNEPHQILVARTERIDFHVSCLKRSREARDESLVQL